MKRGRVFRPHQSEAFNFIKRDDVGALFMEMRLGKSLVAERWALKKAQGEPVLIITPATTIHVWEHELGLEGITAVPLVGSSKAKMKTLEYEHRGFSWFITNPEGVRACPDIAKALPWAVVVLDETGGWFTNPKAQVVKIIRKHLGDVPHRLILTGLPDPNGPEDYFEQMAFTFGEFMGHRSFWTWRQQYMAPAFFGWDLKLGTRKKIKQAVRELAFRKTAKQAGCFVPKVYETRHVYLPPVLKKIYKQIQKDMAAGDAETKWTVVVQNWLSMLAGGIVPSRYDSRRKIEHPFKADELAALMKGELKGKRVVVWARFIREIDLIQKRLKKAGIESGRITGLTKRKARPRILDNFRRERFSVLVIQECVGQFALNLSHADAMAFYSNVWDGGVRGQCEKRLDHMDKREPVLVLDFITRGTIDEAIVATLKEKKSSSKNFAARVMVKSRKLKVA